MIEFTKGDIFAVPVDIRVNTVNCVGVMGTGVALAFKRRYPKMFKEYEKECRDGNITPGKLHIWRDLMEGWIINFPTKRHWRDSSRYEDITDGLHALHEYLIDKGDVSVALPALGSGHGGLDWKTVSGMIYEHLSDLEARIFVFEPSDSKRLGNVLDADVDNKVQEAIADAGFVKADLYSLHIGETESSYPSIAYVKGERELLEKPWIVLLPSKQPLDRELKAIAAITRELKRVAPEIVIGLLRASKKSDIVAQTVLQENLSVALIIPQGVLAQKNIRSLGEDWQSTSHLLVSVAPPEASWSRANLRHAFSILRERSKAALISDPLPTWLEGENGKRWSEKPLLYVRYENASPHANNLLGRLGARPIGKRPESGRPNVKLLSESATYSRI